MKTTAPAESSSPSQAWKIDQIFIHRGLHALCYCSQQHSPQASTHFGKCYLGDPGGQGWSEAGELESCEFEYFQRQALLAATIEQSSLISLTDHQLAAQRPLLVFPKLKLQPLSQWLARQAQPPARAVLLWFARQLLQALDALHRRGYLHGNVRPEHVMLGDDEQLFLVGLGGCEQIGARTCLPRAETKYDAPETVASEFEASSAQDVYAAAVLLREYLGEKFCNAPVIAAMRSLNPSDRPAASELVKLLLALEIELFGQHIQAPRAA